MSRLIDIDKISKDAEWDENYDGFISYSSAMIDEAEIIEAIPIWWIKSKIDAILDSYPDGNKETEILCKLLYEWEKENGK